VVDWRWFDRHPEVVTAGAVLAAVFGCLAAWAVWRLRHRIRLTVRSAGILVAGIAVILAGAELGRRWFFARQPIFPGPDWWQTPASGMPDGKIKRQFHRWMWEPRYLVIEYRPHQFGPFYWATELTYTIWEHQADGTFKAQPPTSTPP
jgi:hypothetical protein